MKNLRPLLIAVTLSLATLELPLADRTATPKQVAADFYNRIPVRPIFASYPVYHPDREPPGYFEKLSQSNDQTTPAETAPAPSAPP